MISSLQIGDHFYFEGQEYVLCYTATGADRQGRTLRLEFMDPLRAQQHLDEQQQRRDALALQLRAGPLVEKIEKQLED